MSTFNARMAKELRMLETDPPYGVSAWPKGDRIDRLEAQITGPEGTPYENGTFYLDIEIPDRYPFEPPKVTFRTPIYHPNIDEAGRICLDTLKMQPKGSWLPSVNISTLLTTIRLLMAQPNPDDGLMADITDLYKHNRQVFDRKAKEWTQIHACQSNGAPKLMSDRLSSATNKDSVSHQVEEIKDEEQQKNNAEVKANSSSGDSASKSTNGEEVDEDEDDWDDDEDDDTIEQLPKRRKTDVEQ